MLRVVAAAAALAATWVLLRHRRRLPRFWRRLAQRADWPMPVHLISLARLPAKRTSALQRAAEAGLTDVSVFDAVDGRELSPGELQRRGVSTYAGWRLAGSCFLVRVRGRGRGRGRGRVGVMVRVRVRVS
jgi:hypothetical protein